MIIYGLIDPRTLLVRYIGQARKFKRPYDHLDCLDIDWCGARTHKTNWIQELHKAGLQYDVCILESVAFDLNSAEIWWIAYGRACGWPLTNSTLGGEGGDTFTNSANPEQARANMRDAQLGRHHTEETKTRIGISNVGRFVSEETRNAVAESNRRRRGIKATQEHKDNISRTLMGHYVSPETRLAVAESNRRRAGK